MLSMSLRDTARPLHTGYTSRFGGCCAAVGIGGEPLACPLDCPASDAAPWLHGRRLAPSAGLARPALPSHAAGSRIQECRNSPRRGCHHFDFLVSVTEWPLRQWHYQCGDCGFLLAVSPRLLWGSVPPHCCFISTMCKSDTLGNRLFASNIDSNLRWMPCTHVC